MRSIFTLLVIVVFAAYAVRSHFIAMLMYWWFGIFRPHDWMWWDVSSLKLPTLAAVIFIVPMVLKGKFPSFGDIISKLLLLLILLAIISEFIAGCEFAIPVNMEAAVVLLIVTSFSHRLLEKPHQVIGLLMVAAFSLYFHSAKIGIVSVMQGKSLYNANVGSGGFTGSNAMAMGTAMGLFFLVFGIQCLSKQRHLELVPFFNDKDWFRKLLLIALSVSIVGGIVFIGLTTSRGSALALIAGIFVWVLLHPRRFAMGSTLTLILIISVSITGIPTELKDRLASAFVDKSELDNSAASRPHYWNVAKNIAADYPSGVGVGCYKTYYNVYDTTDGAFGRNRSVHSSHYAILAELGYAGIFVWALIYLFCFAKLWKIRRQHINEISHSHLSMYYVNFSHAMMAGLLVFLFGGSFYEMPYNDYLWIMFACIIAVHRQNKNVFEPRR